MGSARVLVCGVVSAVVLGLMGVPAVADTPVSTSLPSGFAPGKSTVVARTADSTVYANPDGTQTSNLSNVPVNYAAADGSWQPIDSSLQADPARAGGLRSAANSWRAHFGTTAQGVSVDTSAGSLGIVPVNAKTEAPVTSATGDGVTYADAWPGADLTYRVTSSAVKESVLIKSPSAGNSFTFSVLSGSVASVLSDTAAAAPGWSRDVDGSLVPTGALSSAVQIEAPRVLRADGEPMEAAHAKLSVAGGKLTLSVDPAWLAAQPASAFPINLDPSITPTPSVSHSYKTDGFNCTNCGIQFGNARDGGDTLWRSVAHFGYEGLFGDEILGAQFNTGWQGGTQNAYGVRVFWASAYSFAGAAGHPAVLATGTPGGTTGTISGTALTAQIQSWADSRVSGGAFGFVGTETAGLYTYQTYSMNLAVTYNLPPSTPAGVGFKAAAPSTPACTGGTIDGTQASSWKSVLGAPSARNLYGTFQWWDTASPSAVHTAKSGTFPTGSNNALAWVVSWGPNTFANGHNYAFKVEAYDGWKAGPWSGNCSFHVTDPVATSPTQPGFGPANPGLACGSTVRGDQNIVLEATIKAATAQSQVRAQFTVSYTVNGTAYPKIYTTPYVAYQAAGSLAQVTIAANTPASGNYSIPNGTVFTWSVVAQTQSDNTSSAPTSCGGVTSSGQVPAPQLASTALASDGSGNGVVGTNASVTLTDTSPDVTEYVWSYQQVLPAPLPTACPTVPSNNWAGVGLACSSDGPDDSGNDWNVIQVDPPRTSFSLTVWAIDSTGTVSPATTVNYVVTDIGDGEVTHLWQTDSTSLTAAATSVADAADPDNDLPLSITANSPATNLSWVGGGAPWQTSPGSGGSALHFDGTAGYAATSSPGVPQDTRDNQWDSSDDFTAQVWVRPTTTSTSTPQVAIGQDGSYFSGFWLGLQSGSWTFCMPHTQNQSGAYDGDCATLPAGTSYQNQWALLTAVWDASGGKMILYVATGLSSSPLTTPSVATATITHTISAPATESFTVGRGETAGVNSGFWTGDLEDPTTFTGVMSSNSVLTTATTGPYNPNNQ
ncbi:hypothetical protein SAMN05444157_0738 [Frankineae bacterium MT45]|nr:hypothetical protein SAMN05444157_0738 [Frankineae bacterium MT45]